MRAAKFCEEISALAGRLTFGSGISGCFSITTLITTRKPKPTSMQLWRAASYSSVFSQLILVSASITRSWSTNENLPLRMVELTAISFTTPIIQNRRVSSPGPPATVLSHIKKIGISLAASFAFIKFTASGCSENDSYNGERQCQISQPQRPCPLHRSPCRLQNLCRPIRHRCRRPEDRGGLGRGHGPRYRGRQESRPGRDRRAPGGAPGPR